MTDTHNFRWHSAPPRHNTPRLGVGIQIQHIRFISPVDELTNAFKSFKLSSEASPPGIEASYAIALSLVSRIRHNPDDLDRFCEVLSALQEQKDFSTRAGLFLSAAVNAGSEERYSLRISHLHARIDFLAWRCKKQLSVEGDVGDFFAANADGAHVKLNGSAGDCLAYKARAEISVTKDVGDYAAQYFRTGDLHIMGNAGDYLASRMGTIDPYTYGDAHPAIIVVKGSVGDNPGEFMKYGLITIRGDAGERVGLMKESGVEIYVNGQPKSLCRTQSSYAIPSDLS